MEPTRDELFENLQNGTLEDEELRAAHEQFLKTSNAMNQLQQDFEKKFKDTIDVTKIGDQFVIKSESLSETRKQATRENAERENKRLDIDLQNLEINKEALALAKQANKYAGEAICTSRIALAVSATMMLIALAMYLLSLSK